jgi:hypothetical protein
MRNQFRNRLVIRERMPFLLCAIIMQSIFDTAKKCQVFEYFEEKKRLIFFDSIQSMTLDQMVGLSLNKNKPSLEWELRGATNKQKR